MKADMQIVTGNGLQEDVKNRTVMLTAENWIEMKSVAPFALSPRVGNGDWMGREGTVLERGWGTGVALSVLGGAID